MIAGALAAAASTGWAMQLVTLSNEKRPSPAPVPAPVVVVAPSSAQPASTEAVVGDTFEASAELGLVPERAVNGGAPEPWLAGPNGFPSRAHRDAAALPPGAERDAAFQKLYERALPPFRLQAVLFQQEMDDAIWLAERNPLFETQIPKFQQAKVAAAKITQGIERRDLALIAEGRAELPTDWAEAHRNVTGEHVRHERQDETIMAVSAATTFLTFAAGLTAFATGLTCQQLSPGAGRSRRSP